LCNWRNYDKDKINLSWGYNTATKAFEIKANKDIKQGEELIVSYGHKNNQQYLEYYGFTIENPNEDKAINFYLPNTQILLLAKKNINAAANLALISTEKEDYAKVCDFAIVMRDALKNNYSSTLEEDKEKLSNKESLKLTFNDINILRVLIEEKEIIKSTLDVLNTILFYMANPDKPELQSLHLIKEQAEKNLLSKKKEFENVLKAKNYVIEHTNGFAEIFKRADFLSYLANIAAANEKSAKLRTGVSKYKLMKFKK